ncbi:MAG: ABC transporter permease [Rhodoferax sp.]|uniref:FtsX-like permease family protein n=1 Tax=Rhodoferax sp. TaxID=50421 RepID=UPI00271C4A91|nr:FtsX-like permease family protein [Rhodoferax sp.]MDO8447412.1 ABC transporter permease [Rhodoferax sp.]
MKTIALSFRYLWSRPLAAALNLLLLSLGLASITLVMLTSEQIDRAFERDLAGIDLVVGAKGSPMQLILAGVFHIDVPPGNIPLAEVQALQKDPRVARLIPLSLGDSFRGFRIVGTSPDYLSHYGATLAQGTPWRQSMQTVLGAGVALATGMKAGDTFIGSHGLGGGGHAHGDNPYQVSGVLKPCQCVLDRLILTAAESVWQVHEKASAGDDLSEEDRKVLEAEREITLALIQYSSPLAAVTLPRYVNSSTGMQAAAPAVEVTRLLRMVGVGTEVLRGFGAVLLLTAGLSVFIALWNAVRERRADLAMLRMLGASPAKVAGLLLCEALWLALLASALGLLGGHLLTGLVGWMLQAEKSLPVTGWLWVPAEAWIPAAAVAVAGLAALLPALSAYRVDAGQLLNSR